jgi:PAP_fibrillin
MNKQAGIKLWKLFLPLPFKGRKGWLDMLYLDDDLRVSKGNRGGVFVHVRPSSLLSKKADA